MSRAQQTPTQYSCPCSHLSNFPPSPLLKKTFYAILVWVCGIFMFLKFYLQVCMYVRVCKSLCMCMSVHVYACACICHMCTNAREAQKKDLISLSWSYR